MSGLKIYKYGYDVKKLGQQIFRPRQTKGEWGFFRDVARNDIYGLQQVFIKKGSTYSLMVSDYLEQEFLIYLEDGLAKIEVTGKKDKKRIISLGFQETILFSGISFYKFIKIVAAKDSFIYIFSGSCLGISSKNKDFRKSKTFDRRYKNWAENCIETIINRDHTGKRIFFKKGNSSSLHFHCKKTETYFIHSGKLLLRFRAGQGEDKFFVILPGQSVRITPGLMHQAGGIKDTVIIEVSTRDEDTDSFLVESEFMKMPKLNKLIKN